MTVELTFEQLRECVRIGTARFERVVRLGIQPRGGMVRDGSAAVYGVIGEMAAAQALGRPYRPPLNWEPDMSDGTEVRAALRDGKNRGLLVRPNDDPTARYVLVLVDPNSGECLIPGWAYGVEVKGSGRRLGDPPNHYWVLAQERLRPLSTLPTAPRVVT